MNRNQLIGTLIGKRLAYTIKGVILVKGGSRIINYATKNHVRTDFSSEKIFSDAIDASFFAD